ncbi:hypothetical protein [Bacillus infantis]|uniref:hypothetical protein n=1 Tax=Bacillus infantis TaxID=324767 RepID=UPI0013ED58F1|nr:hypothetical protein [Bacillus infantis]
MKYIEDLAGKTLESIQPLYSGGNPYMIEIKFTDSTVLNINIAHNVERYLQWKIETE